MKTISITVTGKVQGVFFRQSAKNRANEFGINGTVCNLSNGDVFICATGTEEQLERFVSWCRLGPAKAIVDTVFVEEQSYVEFDSFRIVRH